MLNIKARVQAGIAFLSAIHKDKWWKKIDTKNLNLGNAKTCVIGQLSGLYRDGRNELGMSNCEMQALGFYYEGYDFPDQYPVLTRAWRAALKDLNAPKKAVKRKTNG